MPCCRTWSTPAISVGTRCLWSDGATKRSRRKLAKPQPRNASDRETWEYLKRYIARLPKPPAGKLSITSGVASFHFLYLLAPRVSEVATHPMNSIREYRGKWWWFVQGKGGKKAKVPVTDEMLDAPCGTGVSWVRRSATHR